MKTAAVILNHNLPDWTDRLYKTLKPYERDDYEVLVFDNGSKPEGVSQYTSFSSETNLYFGGGLNAAMQMVLDDEQYDSLLFVNNDLTIHPYNFVRTLRKNMFVQPSDGQTPEEQSELAKLGFLPDIDRQVGNIRFDLVAACFYNVEPDGQCHWKTMHNWGTAGAREVPFVDFQCPLISRRLIKAVGEIDADLIYGWGPDTYFAITCNKQGYRMAVLDNVCILHHNSVTIKTGVAGLNMADYCRKAEIGQYNFFTKKGLMKEFHEVRNAGASYKLC